MKIKFEIRKSYYANDQKRYELLMFDGNYHGTQMGWYDNGNIKFIYIKIKGKVIGLYQDWYENGTLHKLSQKRGSRSHGAKIELIYQK